MSSNLDENRTVVDEVPSIGAPSLKAGIEAILLVVDEPVTAITLAQITNTPEVQVNKTLKEIKKEPKNSLSDNSYTFIKKKLADLDNNIK